jgi:hypothetical protein
MAGNQVVIEMGGDGILRVLSSADPEVVYALVTAAWTDLLAQRVAAKVAALQPAPKILAPSAVDRAILRRTRPPQG